MEILFGIVVLIFSVIIHEVAHGYAALSLGDHTAQLAGRLTLNPIRHLDPVGSFLVPLLTYFAGGFILGWARPVPYNPYNLSDQRFGEAKVAVAGPLSNTALALLAGLTLRIIPMESAATEILSFIVIINLVLAVFNLIPVPPLDGSKILFAFLPYRYDHIRANLERYGLIFVLIFVVFLWRFITPIIGYLYSTIVGSGLS